MPTHRMYAADVEEKQCPREVARREFARPFMGQPGIHADKEVLSAKWVKSRRYGLELVIEYK